MYKYMKMTIFTLNECNQNIFIMKLPMKNKLQISIWKIFYYSRNNNNNGYKI